MSIFSRFCFPIAAIFISVIITSPCLAIDSRGTESNWEDHWMLAVNYNEEKQYEAAESEFTAAIEVLEAYSDSDHPYVYVDRARLYLLLDRYQEALPDLNIALASDKLQGAERLIALITRIGTYVNLGMENEAMVDYSTYKKLNVDRPKLEFTKFNVIIRNVPDCKYYKESMTKFFVLSEICEKESDVKWLKSGICIAKRKECHCGYDKLSANPQMSVSDCDYWCDKCKTASLIYCNKVFKTWRCQAVCYSVVEGMADSCYWCCSGGNFYEKCLKFFDNLLQQIGKGCNPAVD